jgi:Family of unknown function (DUF6492)
MDAVLPLTLRDVDRFSILWASLQRFVTGLETLWIVVPAHQHAEIQQLLPAAGSGGIRVRVESELDFLPTLRAFPKAKGWYRQMLIKLRAAERVGSPFYLTLDADVLACRQVDLDALCQEGRAPVHIDPLDLHPKWYRAAADILGAPLPRTGISHAVTPALLHAPSVQGLLALLSERWTSGSYGSGLRGLKQRAGKLQVMLQRLQGSDSADVAGWCAYLCCSRPWAEYALYFSHLEVTGQLTTHFREVTEGLYSVDGSVWHAASFADWDPTPLFQGEGAPYFAVVQSNAFIAVNDVKARLNAFLTAADPAS